MGLPALAVYRSSGYTVDDGHRTPGENMTTPTPLVRALARVLALAAVLVPVSVSAAQAKPVAPKSGGAAATVEWLEVRYVHNGKTFVYYYPKNAPFTNDAGHERINLYTEPVLDNAKLARSHLWRQPSEGEKFKIHLITEQGAASDIVKGGTAWTEKAFVPPAPRPVPPAADPQTKPPAPRPAPTQPNPVGSDPVLGEQPKPPTPPAPIDNGTELGRQQPPAARVTVEADPAVVRAGIAARITEWTWKELEGGRSFIGPDGKKQPRERFLSAAEELVKNDVSSQAAVDFYYIIGPGDNVPAWVTASKDLSGLLVSGRSAFAGFEKKFIECLDRWVYDPKGAPVTYCGGAPDPGQKRTPYAGDPAWLPPFVMDGGKEARSLLRAKGIPPLELVLRIGNSPGTTPRAPGETGERRVSLPSRPATNFATPDLFGKWGDRNVFALDGRILSIVLRTEQTFEGDPPKAVLKQQLGLYDISNESDLYGRRFEFDKPSEQTMSLIEGGKNYRIVLEAKGSDTLIKITRPDGTEPDVSSGGHTLPTLNELFQMRAQKALDSGNRAIIGGKAYRVTGEATTTGNLIFWDEAQLEASRSSIQGGFAGAAAREWTPAMMARVNHNKDGRPQNLGSEVSLGTQVGGKWQGLRWNSEFEVWDPAEGDEFKPKPAPKPPTGTPPGEGSQPTQPTTPATAGPGQSGAKPDPAQADGWPGEISGGYRSDNPRAARLNAALSAAAKERVRFYSIAEEGVPKGPGQRVMGVTSKTPFEKQNIFHPHSMGLWPPGVGGTASATSEQEEVVFSGRVLATKTDRGITFVDLEKIVAEGGDYKTGGLGSYLVGAGISEVTDIQVLGTALGAAGYGAKTEEAIANVRKALAAEAPVKTWNVSGPEFGKGALKAGVNGKNGDVFYCVYPTFKVCNQGADSAPDSVPNVGQGFPLDPTSTTLADGAFRDSTELANGKKLTRVDPKPADAALYFNEEDGKKSWYIAFGMTSKEGGARRSKDPTLAFRDPAADRVKLPKDIHIGGLTLKGAFPDQVTLSMTKGDQPTIEAAGFISAVGQSKDTCLGVVAWWGMTKAVACDRCGAKMDGAVCVAK